MSAKFAKLKDKRDGNELVILGSSVKKHDGVTNWSEEGAQVNVIETVSVNGTSVTPSEKNVDITIDTYTLSSVQNPSSDYSAQYKLMKSVGGTGTPTQVGDTINIPKDKVVESGTLVDITYNSTTHKLYDGLVDVTALIVGPSGTATASDAGKYIKLVIANATSDKIYISVNNLVDAYTAGTGIVLNDNTFSIDTTVVAEKSELFSGDYTDLTNKPTLGTASAKDVPVSGNASTTEVVMGDDTRLTDARTPTSHTHTVSQITDFPTIPDAQIQSDWDQSDNTKKDYIKNKPTIPAAQIQSDWNQSDNTKKDYIKNKPTIPDAQIQSDWNQSDNTKKDFIKNKPTIPASPVQSNWNEADNTSLAYIQNKPTIPDVTVKADKVTGATNGNFAGLDSNGNLTDSGSKASDFLTSHQDISGKADKSNTVLSTYLSRGRKSGTTIGTNSFAFGNDVTASGSYSFAEGYKTVASGNYSHAEGYESTASGSHSHVEGYNNTVSNSNSHCEGANCVASGYEAHVEGYVNYGTGDEVHVEGTCTMASGDNSHVEGVNNFTDSYCTHVEGCGHDVHSSQKLVHVGGVYSDTGQATGATISFQYKMPPDKTLAGSAENMTLGKYAEVIGNGTDYDHRSNARTLDWSGNEELAGDLTIKKGTANEVSVSSLATSVAGKQDALTAGANIVINNNTISAAQIFGTSTSSASATTKVVSIPAITALETGQVIIVQPSVTSEVADSSLQLNNFTAYPMRYNGAAITTSTDSVVWSSKYPSIWVFDGSYWVFAGHGLDSNTTYTLNYSIDAGKYTAGSGTYAVTRYSIIAQKPNGTWEKVTSTSSSYSTGTAKTVNTTGFILNQLRFYNATTSVSSGNQLATNICHEKASTLDLRYSTNCGDTTTWLVGEYIYLVGTIGVDGLFYLDTTTWWTNALPTTNDGKLYIRLGIVLEDTSYKISFFSDRPVFYHDGNNVREYTVLRDELSSVAFSGDYSNLSNTPTIPTNTSDLTNDGDGNSNSYVLNTSLATVATSGDYSDLLNTPSIVSYTESGSRTDKYVTLKDGNTNLIPKAMWPINTGAGGGSLTLNPFIAYYRSGINSTTVIALSNNSYEEYAGNYNLVFEYVSGTITWPINVHWNVDISNFTPTANTWYEMDIKRIMISSNTYVDFGIIMEYAN